MGLANREYMWITDQQQLQSVHVHVNINPRLRSMKATTQRNPGICGYHTTILRIERSAPIRRWRSSSRVVAVVSDWITSRHDSSWKPDCKLIPTCEPQWSNSTTAAAAVVAAAVAVAASKAQTTCQLLQVPRVYKTCRAVTNVKPDVNAV